jgi:hypothetical protein
VLLVYRLAGGSGGLRENGHTHRQKHETNEGTLQLSFHCRART